MTLALPAVVDAQATRIQAQQFAVVGNSGADRVRLEAGPELSAALQMLDLNGVVRAGASTGRGAGRNDLGTSTFTIRSENGTLVGVFGLGRGPQGDRPLDNVLVLSDPQGQSRVVLRVAEDGTPTMQMLDAA